MAWLLSWWYHFAYGRANARWTVASSLAEARRLSQLELALEAEVSARHLSFVETGRATPSREMLLTLANVLDVPLRERNVLLLAAGYAPMYAETSLNDPRMSQVRTGDRDYAKIERASRCHCS